jgi:putative Holliday junction resolvase
VAEWSKAAVLKTAVPQGTVSSNLTPSAMKYLGIDYGTKKIGIAVSDETGSVAFPHSTVASGKDALSRIATLIKEEGVGGVVLGESRNFAGEPNLVQEDIEQFKKDLEQLAGVPVAYEQEFFSSAAAARQYEPEAKSRKANPAQDKLDAAAAALILQSYLDKNKNNGKQN